MWAELQVRQSKLNFIAGGESHPTITEKFRGGHLPRSQLHLLVNCPCVDAASQTRQIQAYEKKTRQKQFPDTFFLWGYSWSYSVVELKHIVQFFFKWEFSTCRLSFCSSPVVLSSCLHAFKSVETKHCVWSLTQWVTTLVQGFVCLILTLFPNVMLASFSSGVAFWGFTELQVSFEFPTSSHSYFWVMLFVVFYLYKYCDLHLSLINSFRLYRIISPWSK